MFGLLRKRRRERLRRQMFPAEWRTLIKRKVRYFHLLTDEEQDRLCEHVRILLDEKYFEGCGGLELTDEIRLTIAAQACLLLLNHPGGVFPRPALDPRLSARVPGPGQGAPRGWQRQRSLHAQAR